MKFTWDPKKEELNRRKHGLSFTEAVGVFDDPYAFIAPDPKHSEEEERHWLIGETETGLVIVVVFTERENGTTTRVISARPASREERRIYEALKRIPL